MDNLTYIVLMMRLELQILINCRQEICKKFNTCDCTKNREVFRH